MSIDVEKKHREKFYISAGDKYHKAYIDIPNYTQTLMYVECLKYYTKHSIWFGC